jgi:alkyl hydroperoxide reductase subunit AhpC
VHPADRVDDFKAINCEVVGASIDSQFTHLAFSNTPRNKGGLGGCKYPLVADLTKSIAKVRPALRVGSKAELSTAGSYMTSRARVIVRT